LLEIGTAVAFYPLEKDQRRAELMVDLNFNRDFRAKSIIGQTEPAA
jgi:hypothetical protein